MEGLGKCLAAQWGGSASNMRHLTSQQGTPWFRGAFHYARGEQANGKFPSEFRTVFIKAPLQKLLRASPKVLTSCTLPSSHTLRIDAEVSLHLQDYPRTSTRDP